jgi:serine/threonine protein kinase
MRFAFFLNYPAFVFFKVPALWADWACAMQLLLLLAADAGCPPVWKATIIQLKTLVFDGLILPDSLRDNIKWKLEDFKLVKLLGQGGYGKVYLAQEVQSNSIVAIKAIPKAKTEKEKIQREIKNQQLLRGQTNVLQIYGTFQDNDNVYLILEYSLGGSLRQLMKATGKFSAKRSAGIIFEVTNAIIACHSRNILHRDIKPDNLLLGATNEIKLADFGCSVLLDPPGSNRVSLFVGTASYGAPEILEEGGEHNKSFDAWPLGVLLFELLVGHRPFDERSSQDEEETDRRVKANKYSLPHDLDKEAKDLISKILVQDKDRISLEDILSHAFIVKNM